MTAVTVPIAQMIASSSSGEVLVTYALGSCLGIAIHDPIAGVGALLHVMLPSSKVATQHETPNPYMYVDTGVPLMFRECYARGARKERIVVRVAGGAFTVGNDTDHFQIGRRNIVTLRQLLWKNGVLLRGEDVGGTHSRHMYLEIASGAVRVRSQRGELVI
jgi:chemotaxis protein CheD